MTIEARFAEGSPDRLALLAAELVAGKPDVLVVATGIIGAIGGKYVLDALGITDHGVRGFALGTAAHGIGTARAFQESEEAGAFSGLAMGLCGLVTAVLFPLGVWLVRALAS